MTEIMDEPRALVRMESQVPIGAGTLALALMSDTEFDARLAALEKGRDRVVRIQRALMREGVDYGTIPGTDKPTLLKPGAEILAQTYGLRSDLRVERRDIGDGITAPSLSYVVRAELHEGSLDGPVVAVGIGAANSWERRYRWRRGGRLCPDCNKAGLVKTRKNQWWHPLDAKPSGGCNANFALDDPQITEQAIGDIENPDPHDLDNTLVKMAAKRARIDAVLTGCAASGIFTQDLEEMQDDDEPADRGAQRSANARPVAQARPVGPTFTGTGRWLGIVKPHEGDFDVREMTQQGETVYAHLFHVVFDGREIDDRVVQIAPSGKDLHEYTTGTRVAVRGSWRTRNQGGQHWTELVATAVEPVTEPLDDAPLPEE